MVDAELRVDARRNRERILRSAARLLAEDPTVSMQRIADEAEVARPTVYRRYPTREALIEAIISQVIEEYGTALAAVTSEHTDVSQALGALIGRLAEIGAAYPVLMGMPIALPSGSEPRVESLTHPAALDALIERGQQEGTVRDDISVPVIRRSLLGAVSASLQLTRDGGTPLTSAEIGDDVARLFLDGTRPRTNKRTPSRSPSIRKA